MRVRVLATAAAAGVLLGLQVAAAGSAAAADDVILVGDTNNVTLTKTDSGATASVTLENQTDGDVDVSVRAGFGAASKCEITAPDDHTLDPQRQQKMTFAFSEGCVPERKEGTDFTVTAGASTFDLHAEPPKKPDPNWIAFVVIFVVAAVISAVLLWQVWRCWKAPDTYPDLSPPGQPEKTRDFKMPLPGLDASWKFSDSWAANATVVTALFAGIFGAKDVANALLGEDNAKDLLSVGLVAAALSLGLVGVSPMVLQGFRTRVLKAVPARKVNGKAVAKDMAAGLYVTPKALLFAAFFTLAGTVGQLSTLLYALMETDFGNDIAIGAAGLIAAALIYWYAWQSTHQNLDTGATLPPPDPSGTSGRTITIQLPTGGERRAVVQDRDAEQPTEEQPVVAIVIPAAAPAESRPSGII